MFLFIIRVCRETSSEVKIRAKPNAERGQSYMLWQVYNCDIHPAHLVTSGSMPSFMHTFILFLVEEILLYFCYSYYRNLKLYEPSSGILTRCLNINAIIP